MSEACRIEVPVLGPKTTLGEAWKKLPRHPFRDVSGAAVEPPRTTGALIAGARYLHAFVDAASEPPLALRARHPHAPVFEDDCVELFWSDPVEPHRYLEVVVNAEGCHYSARVNNPEGSRSSWSVLPGAPLPGLKIVVRGEPAGAVPRDFVRWRCWIALPWAALGQAGPPAPGEERRGNLYRIARGVTTRYEALSPTGRSLPPDFHVPWRFATFVFSDLR